METPSTKTVMLSNVKSLLAYNLPTTATKRMMFRFVWSTASLFDSLESTFITVFIPFIGPLAGADTDSALPEVGALVFVTCLLQAKEPFIITIPAVSSLVLGGESLITGSGAGIPHLMDEVLLLRGEIRNIIREDLKIVVAFVVGGGIGETNRNRDNYCKINVSRRQIYPKPITQGLGYWRIHQAYLVELHHGLWIVYHQAKRSKREETLWDIGIEDHHIQWNLEFHMHARKKSRTNEAKNEQQRGRPSTCYVSLPPNVLR